MAGKVAQCLFCELEFKKVRTWQKYCCSKCADKSKYSRNIEDVTKRNLKYYYENKEELLKKRKENPKTKYMLWKSKLKSNYGITPEKYMQMLDSQNGQCKICEVEIKAIHNSTHIDHDHKTKEIRGLLCAKCNLGLGLFKDNIIYLLKAINYLGG